MRRTAKACWALFKIRVAEQLQYRATALASTCIGSMWALIHIVMFTVFFTYGNAAESGYMSLQQAISYAWLGQILYGFTSVSYNGMDSELHKSIVDGNIALELCRPLDLYWFWFAKTAANMVGFTVWWAIFTLVVALLVPSAVGLAAPQSVAGFLLFLLSIFSAFLLTIAYAMLLTAVRIGLSWGDGPIQALAMFGAVLSGGFLPLQLWPNFMQNLLLMQPFAGIRDIPLRLYVGTMPPAEAPFALALQLIWLLIFITAGCLLMARKLRHVVVQGG